MMRMGLLALVLVLGTTVLTSCATIFTGTTQKVQVLSREQSTSIYINDNYAGNEQVVVRLKKRRNYVIRGEKEGCQAAVISLDKSLSGVTLLNIFNPPGFILDAVTGSWYRFQQDMYWVTPRC